MRALVGLSLFFTLAFPANSQWSFPPGAQLIECGGVSFRLLSFDYSNAAGISDLQDVYPGDQPGGDDAQEWACIKFNGQSYLLIRGRLDIGAGSTKQSITIRRLYSVATKTAVRSGNFLRYLQLLNGDELQIARKKFPHEHSVYVRAKFQKFEFE